MGFFSRPSTILSWCGACCIGVRPAVVVILETEIWPALYREVKRAGCALLVVNGRISDRAYPRYRSWRFFFRDVLAVPDAIYVAERGGSQALSGLRRAARTCERPGKPEVRCRAARAAAPPRAVTDLLDQLRPSAVWIAASTMPGADASDVDEDQAVVRAFGRLAQANPGLLLILVPRKPERFDTAAELLRAAGVRFRRRSRPAAGSQPGAAVCPVARLDRRTGQPVSAGRRSLHGRNTGAPRRA